MKNEVQISNVLYPVLIEGKWHIAERETGKIVYQTAFAVKSLAEMLCANMMGLRLNEARRLWNIEDKLICNVRAISKAS